MGRATADRDGAARLDPADERRKPALGAPRIHGELLKLGFEVAQSSVAKYMVKRRVPPNQGCFRAESSQTQSGVRSQVG